MQVDGIERINIHVAREWLYEGRVVVFSIEGASPHDVDKFVDTIVKTVTAWNPQKPWLALYDVSQSRITPYTRERSIYVNKAIPLGLQGRTAILLPNGMLSVIITNFMNQYMRLNNRQMLREMFTVREKALLWLSAGLLE